MVGVISFSWLLGYLICRISICIWFISFSYWSVLFCPSVKCVSFDEICIFWFSWGFFWQACFLLLIFCVKICENINRGPMAIWIATSVLKMEEFLDQFLFWKWWAKFATYFRERRCARSCREICKRCEALSGFALCAVCGRRNVLDLLVVISLSLRYCKRYKTIR